MCVYGYHECSGKLVGKKKVFRVNLESVQCPKNHANLLIIIDLYSVYNTLHLKLQIYACFDTDHNF